MDREEWDGLLERLRGHLDRIRNWEACSPDPKATRCEQSKHRMLGHLRACQEQWLLVIESFIDRDGPRAKILHPWRKFDAGNYAEVPWDEHMRKFAEGRQRLLGFRDVDWDLEGKWKDREITIGGLTKHLADHEAHHIGCFEKENDERN